MKKHNLIKDESQFESTDPEVNISIPLDQLLKREILISPDSKKNLIAATAASLTDGLTNYAVVSGSPLLYPKEITEGWQDGLIPLTYQASALNQYVLLSQIKQTGEINSPLNSGPARKHQYRFKEFCKELSGLVLDVGSDKPSHSMQLLPSECEYLGLDPYAGGGGI